MGGGGCKGPSVLVLILLMIRTCSDVVGLGREVVMAMDGDFSFHAFRIRMGTWLDVVCETSKKKDIPGTVNLSGCKRDGRIET